MNFICSILPSNLASCVHSFRHPQPVTVLVFMVGPGCRVTLRPEFWFTASSGRGGSKIPRRRVCQLSKGRQRMILPNFPKKKNEIENILGRGGGHATEALPGSVNWWVQIIPIIPSLHFLKCWKLILSHASPVKIENCLNSYTNLCSEKFSLCENCGN